jgi:hypothetical protein
MEVLFNTDCYLPREERIDLWKMDPDEKIVRKELVKVWTRILEKYARPGAKIPSAQEIRRELEEAGVPAAVHAVVAKHWLVFDWMIEDEIRQSVRRELDKFDIVGFIEDVKAAQLDPGLLPALRERIKNSVMNP